MSHDILIWKVALCDSERLLMCQGVNFKGEVFDTKYEVVKIPRR
jgi:hypothetical protein